MKKILYICVAVLLSFSACENDDNESGVVDPSVLIKSITTETQANNVLRVDVNIEFKDNVNYQIIYWKNGQDSVIKKTVPSESNGKAKTTLILLEPATKYNFNILASNEKATTTSDTYSFTTKALPVSVPVYTVVKSSNIMKKELPGYIMQVSGDLPGFITLCNSSGTVLWYEDMGKPVRVANFDTLTNTICCIIGIPFPEDKYRLGDQIVLFDLFGKRILDRATSNDWIAYPHHDIRRMPNGDLILVENFVKTFDLSMYGGSTNEEVWGDGYTIMDSNGNIKKRWDCFGEINPQDYPDIMTKLKDWIHSNSVNWDSEGNIYMTHNKISELWKIDRNTGDVIYRVGKKGNIPFVKPDYPFGLHAPVPLKPNYVLCLDNQGGAGNSSRAIILSVNTETNTVEMPLNISFPLELSSINRSNVELINDNLLMFGSTLGRAIVFADLKGNIQRVIRREHISYRTNYINRIVY